MPRFAQVRLAKFKSLVNKLLGMNRVYGLVILIIITINIIIQNVPPKLVHICYKKLNIVNCHLSNIEMAKQKPSTYATTKINWTHVQIGVEAEGGLQWEHMDSKNNLNYLCFCCYTSQKQTGNCVNYQELSP